MKSGSKSYRKLTLRGIKTGFGRFIAIFAIVALGVGFLAGMLATEPDMHYTCDDFYDRAGMWDIRLRSTLGFDEDDIAAIRSADGVETLNAGYRADVLLKNPDGDGIVTALQSAETNGVCELTLIDGRLPEKAGECVAEVGNGLMGDNYKTGDVFFVSDENENLDEKITVDKFTVVGLVKSPEYFSVEKERSTVGAGTVQMIFFVSADSFCYEVYTDVYVRVFGAAQLTAFTSEYSYLIAGTVSRLETVAETRETDRYDKLISEGREELEKGQTELDEKRAETQTAEADALAEISAREKELAAKENELSAGEEALREGTDKYNKQLAAAMSGFDEKYAQLDTEKAALDETISQLTQNAAALDAQAAAIDALRPFAAADPDIAKHVAEYDAAVMTVQDGLKKAQDGLTSLSAAKAAIDAAKAEAMTQFDAARAELDKTRAALADGRTAIAAAWSAIADAKSELEAKLSDAEKEFSDAQQKLDDGKEELDALAKPVWYVLDRTSNLGYESFGGNADKIAAIARVFPVFFFLVAALVSLTTMTRLIEEERGLIGTLGALGYSHARIAGRYILYATAASVLGSVFGLAVGTRVFPQVIWNTYKIMYSLPPLQMRFDLVHALIASGAAIACTVLATVGAIYGTLRETPASLMRPRAPKPGKRVFLEHIGFIWSRMKFTHKVTARNMLRYKKRFFMTVIGVAGCTALLLTGFGLRDSISNIASLQYDELYKLNLQISVKESPDGLDGELMKILDNKSDIDSYITVSQTNATASSDTCEKQELYLVTVPDGGELGDFITLRQRHGDDIAFDENSAVITEKAAVNLGVGIGGKICVENAGGARAEITVTGVTENYIYSYIYIGSAAYEEAYGEASETNMVFCIAAASDDAGRDALSGRLLADSGVRGLSFTDTISESVSGTFEKMNYIVYVLIVSAGLLAFVVLYNLTNINIAERVREIATIKVLGFYEREVRSYVYRETLLLSFIGALCGLGLGVLLHAFVIRTAEVDIVMFGRDIYFMSFVYAGVLTMLFTAAVMLALMPKLDRIDMVESLKSNE